MGECGSCRGVKSAVFLSFCAVVCICLKHRSIGQNYTRFIYNPLVCPLHKRRMNLYLFYELYIYIEGVCFVVLCADILFGCELYALEALESKSAFE